MIQISLFLVYRWSSWAWRSNLGGEIGGVAGRRGLGLVVRSGQRGLGSAGVLQLEFGIKFGFWFDAWDIIWCSPYHFITCNKM